jgi:hypothetical protein
MYMADQTLEIVVQSKWKVKQINEYSGADLVYGET